MSPQVVLPPGFAIKRLARSGSSSTSLEAAQRVHKSSAKAIYYVAQLMMDGVARIDDEIWVDCRTIGFRRDNCTIRVARLALSESGHLVLTGRERPSLISGCKAREWVWCGASGSIRQSSPVVDSRPSLQQLVMENDHLRGLLSEALERIESLEKEIKEAAGAA